MEKESKDRKKSCGKILENNGMAKTKQQKGLMEWKKNAPSYRMSVPFLCTVTVETKGKVKSVNESVQIIHYQAQFVHQLMKAEGQGCWGGSATVDV